MTREDPSTATPERLGEEGEACAQCGTPLAIDQRYCLTCGTARAEPRLDFQRALSDDRPGDRRRSAAAPSGIQWSPLLVVFSIAVLGVMLLLGVLIGKDDNEVTVTEVPAATTTTQSGAPEGSTPPATTAPPAETTPAPAAGGQGTPGQGAGNSKQGNAAGGDAAGTGAAGGGAEGADAGGGIRAPGGTD